MFNTAATTITPAQEPLTKLRQAGTTAPMAVRSRSPGPLSWGTFVARGRYRADRQQIIRRRPG
jgi:hypothetical protein